MTAIKMTERDMQVLDFIKEYKCADTETLTKLFFVSQATCEKRMRKLVEARKLNRYRQDILHSYVYYKGQRPTNIKHSLLMSKVYSILHSSYQVVKCRREYEFKYLNKTQRADLMCVIRLDNKLIPIIVEVELCKTYKYKYEEFIHSKYYQKYFPIEPVIIVVSNNTPKSNTGNIVHIRLDELDKLENLRSLI